MGLWDAGVGQGQGGEMGALGPAHSLLRSRGLEAFLILPAVTVVIKISLLFYLQQSN